MQWKTFRFAILNSKERNLFMEKKINSSGKEIMHNKFAKIDFGNGLQRNRRTREIKRERTVSTARLLLCQKYFFFTFCCLNLI